MQLYGIGSSGLSFVLADGYLPISRGRRDDCVLALKSPSGKMSLFGYEYDDGRTLDEMVEQAIAAHEAQLAEQTAADAAAAADAPADQADEQEPEPDGFEAYLTQHAGELCAFTDRLIAEDDALYPDFAGLRVRSCVFKKGTRCTQADIVFEQKSRRTTDALFGNMAATGR